MKGKKLKKSLLIIMILIFCIFVNATERAVSIHNNRQDITSCEGKLKLKLVRIWGGEEEEDENKFFKSPINMLIDKQGLVYICDQHSHFIKVFKGSGEYIRTIGRKGKGPGDLYGPIFMSLYPDGDLVVSEKGGLRIQHFSPKGKSKKIKKVDRYARWLGVTSKNQLVVYEHYKTLRSSKLLSIWNDRGKTIKEIGTYHDKVRTFLGSDKLSFAIDDEDNIYAMNRLAPVIRKYAPDGTMIMAITFEPPFDLPVKISLNERGDEIKRVEEGDYTDKYRETRSGKSINIQGTGKRRKSVCKHMAIDTGKRIYVVTYKRLLTLEEIRRGPSIIGSHDFIKVIKREDPLDKEQNYLGVLVFNHEGKAIAEAPLTTYCDGIYVNGNRMFIIDGLINQRILEYEMQIED
jgi:hypothetical protein